MTVSTEPTDHITHLSGRMVSEREYHRYEWLPGRPAPAEVEQFFNLSPGARIVLDPEHPARPAMFMSGINTGQHRGRQHIVVARSMSDLTWPAFLAGVQNRHRGESAAYVKRLTAPIWSAIAESKKRVSMQRRAMAFAQQAATDA